MAFVLAILAVAALGSSCSALKDAEPWTQTLTYNDDGGRSPVAITPKVLQGDAADGVIQIVNNTVVERGFAIDELAVYETIPSGQTKNVDVREAKNHRTYTFYDHKHPGEIKGTIVVLYKSAAERG